MGFDDLFDNYDDINDDDTNERSSGNEFTDDGYENDFGYDENNSFDY